MGTFNQLQLIAPDHAGSHADRQAPSIFDFSQAPTWPASPAMSVEETLLAWDEIFAGIFSLSTSSWGDVFSRNGKSSRSKTSADTACPLNLSDDRLKQSELHELMRGKTITHIGDVIGFMQQLLVHGATLY